MRSDDRSVSKAQSHSTASLDSTAMPLRPGIHDAVNSAIDTSTSELDPQLVSKITEHVVSALKKEMLNTTSTASQPVSQQQNTNPAQSRADRARASSSTTHQHPRHPSESRRSDHAETPLYHPAPMQARQIIPSPPTSPASSQLPPRYTPPSPVRYAASSRSCSSPEPSSEAGLGSRRGSRSSTSGQEEFRSRSRMRTVRVPSAVEETSLEKAWKPLFSNGKPTPRLGQFLRGLAKHIIDGSPPLNSIVVTPGKLADFFQSTELPNEMYPWTNIFGGKLTNMAISKLFLALRCPHHLVQFGDQDTPTIPGLTPAGFESFMTCLIQAYPDQEFRRISKAVKDMPISNADEPSERFPKELTRRLFPATSDMMQCQRLAAAVSLDPSIRLNHSSDLPPPPPALPHSSSAPTDRGRPAAYDDDELRAPSLPIERERKPYSGQGGSRIQESRRPPSNGPKDISQPQSRLARASSTAATRPIDVSRSHRLSMGNPPPSSGGRYTHSPGMANPYTRSEGANVADIPAGYYASNLPPDHDDRRPYRRQTNDEEMARGFGVRGGAGPGYEHGQAVQAGSYPGQAQAQAGSYSGSRGGGRY